MNIQIETTPPGKQDKKIDEGYKESDAMWISLVSAIKMGSPMMSAATAKCVDWKIQRNLAALSCVRSNHDNIRHKFRRKNEVFVPKMIHFIMPEIRQLGIAPI